MRIYKNLNYKVIAYVILRTKCVIPFFRIRNPCSYLPPKRRRENAEVQNVRDMDVRISKIRRSMLKITSSLKAFGLV